MRLALAAIAVFLAACNTGTTGGAASSSRTPVAPPTPAVAQRCAGQAATAHPLALSRGLGQTQPVGVLDLSNPVKPVLLCTIDGMDGGRFISGGRVAFWAGDKIGVIDLATGARSATAKLAGRPFSGTFSKDGSKFAYRVSDDAGGITTHLWISGTDRTLYRQEPLGGHGGAPWGPTDQLAFSADGQELLDYFTFRGQSGPPNFQVFRMDGSLVVQSVVDAFGVWSQSGTVLYSFVWNTPPVTGRIDAAEPNGHPTIADSLTGFFWPVLAPDGASIVFQAYDTSTPGESTGGLPHLYRIDLQTHAVSQVTSAISTEPVFVGLSTVWSNEGKRCECGPGGSSAPDGAVLAHDLTTGRDSPVDMSFYRALNPLPPDQSPLPSTYVVLDVWF
jgi:hypothetical protein